MIKRNLFLAIATLLMLGYGFNLDRECATWHPPLEYPAHCPSYQ